jgi:hypothetical protein
MEWMVFGTTTAYVERAQKQSRRANLVGVFCATQLLPNLWWTRSSWIPLLLIAAADDDRCALELSLNTLRLTKMLCAGCVSLCTAAALGLGFWRSERSADAHE